MKRFTTLATTLLRTCVTLLLLPITLYGQQNIEVREELSGNVNLEACNAIRLWPGASYKAENSEVLTARITSENGCESVLQPFTESDYAEPYSSVPSIDKSLDFVDARGDYSVSNGNIVYHVPLSSGNGGLIDPLNLTYSGSNDGIVGKGWSISGFSNIMWSTTKVNEYGKSVAPPGSYDVTSLPSFFSLDGHRLLRLNHHSENDGVFVTEVESYNNIKSHGQYQSSLLPAWYSVETKQGLYLEYGRTENSKVTGQNQDGTPVVFEWKLNLKRDKFGNEVRYIYQQFGSQGIHVPTRIEYYRVNDSKPSQFLYSIEYTPNTPEARATPSLDTSLGNTKRHSIKP